MTVLPTVRRQLLLAAERQATALAAEDGRRPGRPRVLRAGALVATASVAIAIVVAALAVVLIHGPRAARPPARVVDRSTSLLSRPLRFPRLGQGERCPTSPGRAVHNRYFSGIALGSGPVRVVLADTGDLRHGRVEIQGARDGSGYGIATLWFALRAYRGPFVVRAARLGTPGRIAVQPGDGGQRPGRGPLVVEAGPTLNTYPNGDRTVPGSTWVGSPGCYAWQVDGRGLSEVIVFDARLG
jgi:hypothetical protein